MDTNWMQRLQGYIEAELHDAALYRALAQQASSEIDRQLLLEFAEDEQSHAQGFQQLYRQMFNRSYTPAVPAPKPDEPYVDMLRGRVLDESGDFRKYNLAHQEAKTDALKQALYRALTDENVHALRLLYLLSHY